MNTFFSSTPMAICKLATQSLTSAIVLGALGCLTFPLFALPESPLGKIDLSVNARATYDSNVFSMPTNTFNARKATTSSLKSSGDLILQLTPAAHFTKKIKWVELKGTLGARGAYFIRNKEKNYVNPITTFSFDFDEVEFPVGRPPSICI